MKSLIWGFLVLTLPLVAKPQGAFGPGSEELSHNFSELTQSSGELTLNAAVEEALAGSPSLAESGARVSAAKWQLVSTRSLLLPEIDFFARHSFDNQYETLPFQAGTLSASVPIAYPETAYGLELSWTLFDGLAGWNKTAASSLKQDAAGAARERQRFEIKKKIELQYNAVLAAIQLSEVAVKNLKTIEDSLSLSQSRLRNGVSTAPDVLRAQVQQTEAEAEVQRTVDTIVIQREKLRQTMGLQTDERSVTGELPLPTKKDVISNLQFSGVEDRDDIKALQLEDRASERERSAAWGELFPSVALTGRLENYDNTDYAYGGRDGNFRNAYDVGLTLKWTLLDGGKTLAKPGLASAEREIARSRLKESVIAAPTEFELWKRRYLYSANLYEARVRNIQRSEESLRIIKLSFEQGRRIINEVLDAETDLFRARAGAVQSRFEAAEALNQLELVVGKDLL